MDGPTAAAAGKVSISKWHELVRIGDAPAPAIRAPRCTRWRLIDVCDYWRRRAEQGNPQAAERLMRQTTKASRKASEQRRRTRTVNVEA